jgi:hypothetical protein
MSISVVIVALQSLILARSLAAAVTEPERVVRRYISKTSALTAASDPWIQILEAGRMIRTGSQMRSRAPSSVGYAEEFGSLTADYHLYVVS